jgi:hypothetical protein
MANVAPMNLRQIPTAGMPQEAPTQVDMTPPEQKVKPGDQVVQIDLTDGGVQINFGGVPNVASEDSKDHDANLAMHIEAGSLGAVADELLRLINDDRMRQEQRLEDVAKGIELLGIKLEEPRSEPNDEGISVVKHPLLLEAVLRFQANARGEMLPADGPVKVSNEGDQIKQLDQVANALQTDMNHYLTSGAPEYYPDTDRMFFSLGLGGEAYKKVYYHPLKRRPVSETIDRKDLILSDGAVAIEAAARVTHRSKMKPSDVRRMQLAGTWRDITLTSSTFTMGNVVDVELANISGVDPKTLMEPREVDREIYECYCELDLRGFEHKEDGEATGLPLPYRVTLDKDSRQVLEIRRWWEEGDENYTRKEVFVEYVFVPSFSGLNLGLLHILGNANRALTAAWRIALDNGMLANFPGGIMARSSGRQQTTTIRVGPGQVAPLDVDGVPLKEAFLPLPYRDITAGFMQMIQNVEQTAQRVGGTAEMAVGEGRQDAPVGSTIAMIEQATKVLNAVHKRMHSAQAKEFALLKELFRRDPESLWRSNRNPGFQKDAEMLQEALDNYDIVPKADPNCSSQTLRIQKAVALKQLAAQNPQLYDMQEVDRRILEMVDIEDIDSLWSKVPPQGPMQDPALMMEAQAKVMTAQAKQQEVQIKAQAAQMDNQTKALVTEANVQKLKTDQLRAVTDSQNHSEDRKSKLRLEQMKLQQTAMVHADKLRQSDIHKKMEISSQGDQQDREHRHASKERSRERMFNVLTQPPVPPAADKGE